MIIAKGTIDILERLKHKGAAWQTQRVAETCFSELKSLLMDSEWWELKIAHSHYELGEGGGEFYGVINKLISKYSE